MQLKKSVTSSDALLEATGADRPGRPVRVGLVLDGSEQYGVLECVRDLAQALDRRVVRVVGVFFGAGSAREALEPHCDEICDLHTGCLLPLSRPGYGKFYLPNIAQKAVFFIRAVSATAAAIRRLRLDVVHANMYPVHWAAGLACRASGTPCIWHWHGASTPALRMKVAYAGMSALATRIACISQFVAHSLPAAVQPRTRVVYNGIDCVAIRIGQRQGVLRAALGLGRDVPLVAIFGSLTIYKGHEYFIQAAHTVLQHVPGARFAIVGGEAEVQRLRYGREARLRALIAQLGIADRVLFAGEIAGARLHMADCDVICMPTVPIGIQGEGFGLVMAEAMAAGVPVIATACGAPPEVIRDGVNGLLVPPFDSAALAQAMLQLLTDDDRRRRIARAGQQHVTAHFDIACAARAMEVIYCECRRDRDTSPHRLCHVALPHEVRAIPAHDAATRCTG